jgi:hypothetical protein
MLIAHAKIGPLDIILEDPYTRKTLDRAEVAELVRFSGIRQYRFKWTFEPYERVLRVTLIIDPLNRYYEQHISAAVYGVLSGYQRDYGNSPLFDVSTSNGMLRITFELIKDKDEHPWTRGISLKKMEGVAMNIMNHVRERSESVHVRVVHGEQLYNSNNFTVDTVLSR